MFTQLFWFPKWNKCSTSYFHSSVCRSAGTCVQTQAWIISNKEVNHSILSVWNYCTINYPWIINMVSLLLLQITKVNWVWYICHFFPIQMQRLPFEKDLHGGARSNPVESSNEKVKVSTSVKLILFCIYKMLC